MQEFTWTNIRAKAMNGKLIASASPVEHLVSRNWKLRGCVLAASLALAGCGGSSSSSSSGPTSFAHSVTLTWDASSSASVAGYNIFRSAQSGGPYAIVNSSGPVSNLTFTDTSVQAGKTYYYALTAVAGNGAESSFSGEVAATIPSP